MTQDWNERRPGGPGQASGRAGGRAGGPNASDGPAASGGRAASDGRAASGGRAALATIGGVLAIAVVLGILYVTFRGSSVPPASAIGASAPASASPATPGAASPAAHGPLSGAQSYLAGRSGTVRVALYDLATGREWSLGGGMAQDEASVVKVNILEALLLKRPAGLTSYDQLLAQKMIEDSDNDAATTLWNLVGGAPGIGSYNSQAGLAQTTPSACVQCRDFPWPGWGLTTTTPEDQVTMLRRLVQPGGPLTTAQRDYALSLMENVTSGQRWGVSGGVPGGVTVALKNGWLPLNRAGSNWQVNSVGWVSGGGRDYVLAMFSTGNPSEKYGIATLDAIGARVWNGLAHRAA